MSGRMRIQLDRSPSPWIPQKSEQCTYLVTVPRGLNGDITALTHKLHFDHVLILLHHAGDSPHLHLTTLDLSRARSFPTDM